MKTEGTITQRLPAWIKQRQPNSADLIRHRKYNLCVVCEERDAVPSDTQMMVRIPDSGEDAIITAVVTRWWTCQKCEEGSK